MMERPRNVSKLDQQRRGTTTIRFEFHCNIFVNILQFYNTGYRSSLNYSNLNTVCGKHLSDEKPGLENLKGQTGKVHCRTQTY